MTGEAVVVLGGGRQSESIVGDVVNTASRLEGPAPVGGVLVGETTWRATRRAIAYRSAGSVVAKGKAEPLAVWETGSRSPGSVSTSRRAGARRWSGARRSCGCWPTPWPGSAPTGTHGWSPWSAPPASARAAGRRATRGRRRRARADHLAPRPLTALRRGGDLLGAGGDGQGPGGDPGDRPGRHRQGEAVRDGRRPAPRPGRGPLGRGAPAAAGRAGRRRRAGP
jgi:hypothetical protein